MLKVARRDAFEVRANTTQFGSDETIDKMQAPIQPGKQLVFNVVVNRQRDLGTVWPDFSKINDAHQGNIPAHRLERILIWRIAIDRQEDGVRLKAKRAAKAEIDRL